MGEHMCSNDSIYIYIYTYTEREEYTYRESDDCRRQGWHTELRRHTPTPGLAPLHDYISVSASFPLFDSALSCISGNAGCTEGESERWGLIRHVHTGPTVTRGGVRGVVI